MPLASYPTALVPGESGERPIRTQKMSDISSDSYSVFDFSEFTEEDFAQIDAAILSHMQGDDATGDSSFQSEIGGLNLSSLTPEELAQLDSAVSIKLNEHKDCPSIQIEIEDGGATPLQVVECSTQPSPLKQFRSRRILSVSDLVSPAWCEVQFDYGLRGKRSRPIGARPTSFVSSSGKTISVEKSVAVKNDVRTKQGLAVHKELERELRMVELKVDISSEETRWALRLVNMLACLKCMLVDGFTREMPVFGIVHDEVLVGIVDEVIRVPYPPVSANSPERASPKRPLDKPHSKSKAKKARTRSISPQNVIPSCLESREKVLDPPNRSETMVIEEPTSSPSAVNPPSMLYLMDNKTRRYRTVPPHHDTLSGRLQLMLYRRLLSQLVAKSPPYDFGPLWKRLGVASSSRFPTKFLVQANLISDNTEFQTTCLDDVVTSWHKLVKEANIQGINENLELVYRLRPAPDIKQKGKAIALPVLDECETANTPKDIPVQIAALIGAESSTAGPSNRMENSLMTGGPSANSNNRPSGLSSVSDDLEDAQLQWAIQQSMMPPSDREDKFPAGATSLPRSVQSLPEPNGIDRFEIVGRKEFLHDDLELDGYLSHIFKWWRGERKPEGVPLEHASRCFTCEYANDCEWRAQKALEPSNTVHR
ncbi:hypothetical protein BYT27DRAFT_7166540 [Phlegmacium glaucopus]|nr:hypothetical protein BYT27DRAFT_7166540 [Phlegmacium glaucopus]